MERLDKDREQELQPKRMKYAISEIQKLGLEITDKTETSIVFAFKGSFVTFYPYSGWATGETIKDGRGIENLLKQLSEL
jgi:hypothetical protein